MNLNISNWKEFQVSKIFTMLNGKGITHNEISENSGSFAAVQSGENNNGILGYIDLDYCKKMDYTYSEKACLTVARTGTAGFVSFQEHGCAVGDSAKILILNKESQTSYHYLFLQTVLNLNRYKYSYGRKVTEKKYMNDYIELPVKKNANNSIFIDEKYKYSESGYVPDWEFMEHYIKFLYHKPIATKNTGDVSLSLDTDNWKYFLLKDICRIDMGNKLDFSKMTIENPSINFVGRSANNNGVVDKVDYISDIKPYESGCVTVALGGSIGSSFLQLECFYTSQNVSVLKFETNTPSSVKLFIACMIMNECQYKFYPFGRELNTHIRTDFGFSLPIQFSSGVPVIDETKKHSQEGYIPDWDFMADYIQSLPYGDKLS